MQQPQIQGNWVRTDESPHRLEVARTSEPDVVAIRSTYPEAEGQPMTVTRGQFEHLANAYRDGKLSSILGSGAAGGTSGSRR